MPCQQCRRSHDCGDLIENPPAKPFGFGGKPPPLAIRKSKAATSELLPENTILLDKILDDLLLALVHPTGNGNDEKRKWIQRRLHRRSVSRPEPLYAGAVCRNAADVNRVSGHYAITAKANVVQRSRFNFFREARNWYNRTSDHGALEERFENVIALSDEFFQEVMEHPIPTDLEVVKLLSSAPAVLDLFVWLSYRCFTAKEKDTDFRTFWLGATARSGRICPTAKISGKAAAMAKDHPPRLTGMPSEQQPRWPLFAGRPCDCCAADPCLGTKVDGQERRLEELPRCRRNLWSASRISVGEKLSA